ncbi:hypothetical protein QYM36_010851 [Artemia franciscana]|uniref:Uncharacterized protein n=1 Tax=Artemia franciscana TaxID=6661 RepID=A0AA88HVB7_ARTSF|nr:hypothetical protein QYM36_010851 [Artemia franciscana]
MNQLTSPSRKIPRIPSKQGKSVDNIDNDIKDQDKELENVKANGKNLAILEGNEPLEQINGFIRKLLVHLTRGEWASVEAVVKMLENTGIPRPLSEVSEEVSGFTPLMYAVRDNRLPYLEKFMELGCDINARSRDGCSVLQLAVSQSREDIIRFLLSRKPDVNILWNGQTLLHTAAARQGGSSLNIVRLVLHHNKDLKLKPNNEGQMPIHLAIENGNFNVVKELLQTHSEFQVTKECGSKCDTPLHLAARRKDLEMAKILLEFGAIVDARNKDGQAALHIAASGGDESLVRVLHSHHANPNLSDKEDRTPLHLAAENGRTTVVEVLADRYKASLLERTKDGSTLLHVASLNGHPETALMLLKKGVPLHMPNKSGARSIHTAAKLGHVAVVQTLIQRGEQVDTTTNDNYTALHIAVEGGKALVVETLLGYGAHVHIKAGSELETPLHVAARTHDGGDRCAVMLLKSGADPNVKNAFGLTPLHVAAKYGNLETVKLLLDDGADPTVQDSLGETPLHHAAENSHLLIVTQLCTHATILGHSNLINMQSSSGETVLHSAAKNSKSDVNLIMVLLKNGANAALFTHSENETVLHYCAKAGHAKMMEVIFSEGNNFQQVINIQDRCGRSPLLLAAKYGHTRVMDLLLKNQARVDVFDSEGFSALHYASESGHSSSCDLLLIHNAFVNSKSRQGLTPLHLAALKGYTNLVKRLITIHGATIDSLTLRKETPLQLAAESGQLEVCRLLLELGSNPEATDDTGQRSLHRAAQKNHSSVLALFLQYQPGLAGSANKEGNTCAHIAAIQGSVAVLQELMNVDKGAVTSARNRTSEATPLHLAAEGGHSEVVKVLLECGASSLDENKIGFTAVHIAAMYGHAQVLDILRKSNPASLKSHSRKNGLTALHVAACYGQPDTVRDLLSQVPAGTRSEVPNHLILASVPVLKELDGESGLTPLHLAAYSGDENVVRLLLNSPGVSVDSPSNQHVSAIT